MTGFVPIEALSSLSPQALGMVSAGTAPAWQELPSSVGPTAAPGAFGQLVAEGLAQVNGQLMASQVDLQKLAVGEAPNLHQIMINLEERRLSFQLMMQVRSRLLEAYQDIMKMPL